MTKTLDEQIAARKQQAVDRKIFEKANLVARKVGERDANVSTNGYGDRKLVHVFNDAATSLEVRHTLTRDHLDNYDRWQYDRGSVEISYKGKPVFSANGKATNTVTRYAPGEWESKLDTFHLAAQQVVEKERIAAEQKLAAERAAAAQKEAERKKAEEKEKRERWGLEEDSSHEIAVVRQNDLNKTAAKLKVG